MFTIMVPGIGLKTLTLRTKMAVFSFLLVLLVVAIGGFFVIQKVTLVVEEEMGLRALAIARTLAQMDEIKDHVGVPGGWSFCRFSSWAAFMPVL